MRNPCHLDQTYGELFIIADINKEHRENRIAPLGAPSPSKFAPDQFGSIKKGQIIMINPWVSHRHMLP